MTLASSVASGRQRRVALIVQGVLVVALVATFALRDVPVAFMSLVPALIIAQLMTTYLLTSQSVQQRCPATALLAAGYVITAVSYNVAPHIVFGAHAASAMFPAFGLIAHVGFAASFVGYAFLEGFCNQRTFGQRQYLVRLAAIITMSAVFPLACTAILCLLPAGAEATFASFQWLAVPITLAAYIIYSLRVTPTVTNVWMRVALFADLADAVLVLGSPQNSLGIFGAQVFGLITCAAMPAVYIIEFNWMYARLVGMTNELQRQALVDQLTDVGNRRRFDDHIGRLCEAQVRGKLNRFSVILLDIDDFKAYNDTYGHVAGDECLKKIAKTIQRVLYRPGDEVARYGGEEFVVILQAAGFADGELVAERIRKAVWDLAIAHTGSPFGRITISLGFASAPEHGNNPDELLTNADTALYESKRDGKNRVTRYLDAMPAPITTG